MPKFREKPVEIEARQLTPETLKSIKRWIGAYPHRRRPAWRTRQTGDRHS